MARSAWIWGVVWLAWPLAGQEPVKFNRDIRPIMSDTCFRCHGPDRSSRMAGLRLDLRDSALQKTKSGVTPIVPGDAEKSAIVQRIFAASPAKLMPPPHAHKELTAAQKEKIRQWVKEGAVYEGHWAYLPVKRPAIPPGPAHPIDAFIQERLAREGVKPSPEADKRTLLRRVTFDLTGLPPAAEEMRAFLADPSPDAYEKVVERLLASPRHAETMAMRWLDAVRYADSAGFHGDNLVPAWPYRDYVLKAFRENKPFDEFTREQLAGDLLPAATREQLTASAFNRLSRMSAEGGIQPKEYLAKYGADRVRTVSTVWLGATTGCAECHDHKFDPILAKDFYAMKAFFADIKETGLVRDRGPLAWGSKLALPTDEQGARLKDLETRIETASEALAKKAAAMDDRRWLWEELTLKEHAAGKLAWQYQRPVSATAANGATLTIYNDEEVDANFYLNGSLASQKRPGEGLVVASGANPDNETYTVQIRPGAGAWTALGIDVHQDESLPGNRLARGADRFLLTEVDVDGASFVLATSHLFGEMPENGASFAIDGDPKTGWGASYGEARNPFLALRFAKPLTTAADTVLTIRLRQDSHLRKATIGRFRVALSAGVHSWPELGESGRKNRLMLAQKLTQFMLNIPTDLGLPPNVQRALETEEAERSDDQKKTVLDHFVWSELGEDLAALKKLEAEYALLDASIPRVLVTERMRPRVTRVLKRGNFLDETGEVVEPAIPEFLGALKVEGRRANRLDLANWLVSPENPLTPRTFANRLWRQFFGTGFSKVLEDLGSQGEWPTHPELLDWLAAEFVKPEWKAEGAHAWDVKHLVKTIVTSHTYKQSSLTTPQLEGRDPDNRLLARQSRFRVEAESVRDTALAVSGLLVEKFGGPSVKPAQPEGYLAAMNFPKREYAADKGEDLYRRSVYTQWLRTFLHPSLLTFDAPTREECTVNRVNSNTPLQALVLLNDPIFVETARVFGQRMVQSGGKTFDQRLTWAFEQALNRAPDKEERKLLGALYKRTVAQYKAAPAEAARLLAMGEAPQAAGADPVELAASAAVARAILNLHETITRN
ncbi:MAG: PSD1 and planctomycete cytochrome C domain-containing protein [Bryobacteraceae bacterium]|nr:PSD1 and planctomycete cytochrome C domain-containing protein [Bryobacteraceae bacterium]